MTKDTKDIVITRGTKVVLPIAMLLSIIGCAWWLRGAIDDFKVEQNKNFESINRHMEQRYWQNHGELVNFAYNLDQDNRAVSRADGRLGLIVPSVPINASSINQIP